MGEKTGIAWTTHSWSPWVGCQAVSAACDHCYAEELTNRWGGDFSIRRRTSPAYWRNLAKWDRNAPTSGETVFPSMCDPFDNKAPDGALTDFWEQIRRCHRLTFLLLTKRPQNVAARLPADWGDGWPNVWLGITAEDQTEYDRRWPHLAAIPAALRFVSYEPALGPLDIAGHAAKPGWLIAGGESGNQARPMKAAWVQSIQRQCAALGVAYFFKQIGSRHRGWPNTIIGKGDDPEQWPAEFRVQQFPGVRGDADGRV